MICDISCTFHETQPKIGNQIQNNHKAGWVRNIQTNKRVRHSACQHRLKDKPRDLGHDGGTLFEMVMIDKRCVYVCAYVCACVCVCVY